MLKYTDTKIVFREVPNEITLAINISGCPCHCHGCHSEYLAQDIGEPLDDKSLDKLISQNPGISCVSFMGGDGDPSCVTSLSDYVRKKYKLKTCWYSGRTLEYNSKFISAFDYIKVGPYMEEYGPLDSSTTNQRFYAITFNSSKKEYELNDITYKFNNTNVF